MGSVGLIRDHKGPMGSVGLIRDHKGPMGSIGSMGGYRDLIGAREGSRGGSHGTYRIHKGLWEP